LNYDERGCTRFGFSETFDCEYFNEKRERGSKIVETILDHSFVDDKMTMR
jgi:hypothetical protein